MLDPSSAAGLDRSGVISFDPLRKIGWRLRRRLSTILMLVNSPVQYDMTRTKRYLKHVPRLGSKEFKNKKRRTARAEYIQIRRGASRRQSTRLKIAR
jgi:hypothetical protein